MRRTRKILLVTLLLGWGWTVTAERGVGRLGAGAARFALVVGNDSYKHIPHLDNPRSDAQLVAKALHRQGFELMGGDALLDLDKAGLDRALENFGDWLSRFPGAIAVFYYAGHGLQVEGGNYLLPVDANPDTPSDLRRQTVTADDVVQEMKDAGASLNVVILDACRNNPFGGRGLRDAGTGLAEMHKVPKGTLIVYATQPGNVAQDGPKGGHSPFAAALGRAIDQPGLELRRAFDAVGLDVMRATGDIQQPWVSSSPVEGEFCFAGCGAAGESDTARQLREAQAEIERLKAWRVAQVPAVPEEPPTKPKQSEADFGIEMVDIPGGEFRVGADEFAPNGTVQVAAFSIGKTEVTQGQWRSVMGSKPPKLHFKECGDNCPVENVSFQDIQQFIQKLNAKTGGHYHYRLPTAREWLVACLGGEILEYCGANNPDDVGWFRSNSINQTHPVKQKKANHWGIYDLSGNVMEWTADCENGSCLLRGGAWYNKEGFVRASNLERQAPSFRDSGKGFRLARNG